MKRFFTTPPPGTQSKRLKKTKKEIRNVQLKNNNHVHVHLLTVEVPEANAPSAQTKRLFTVE
jgi:hypothetical protein